MKILQINSVCGYGSTGRITTELYKAYEDHGYECIIAYGRGTAPKGYKTIKIGSNLDNYTHVIKTRILDKHGFGSKKATEKFIEKVKIYNPDIIHLHNIHGYYINIEILFNYLKESNKKVIWTLHDCWAFTGHCSHFDYVKCNRWKYECLDCKQRREYPSFILLDNSKYNFNKKINIFLGIKDMKIVTPSKWLAKLVKKSFLNEYDVEVIYNGIDLNLFKPRKSNLREKYNIVDKIILLGVANIWEERKGINTFIDLNKVLDDKYKIFLVGLSDEQIRRLPKNIIGIKRTNTIEELVEIYSMADIFINTSYEETMGLTTVEALATGTSVIVRDSTAMPEIVENKDNIFNNLEDLIEKIKNLKHKNYSEKNRIKAQNYKDTNMLKGYLNIL